MFTALRHRKSYTSDITVNTFIMLSWSAYGALLLLAVLMTFLPTAWRWGVIPLPTPLTTPKQFAADPPRPTNNSFAWWSPTLATNNGNRRKRTETDGGAVVLHEEDLLRQRRRSGVAAIDGLGRAEGQLHSAGASISLQAAPSDAPTIAPTPRPTSAPPSYARVR